MPLVKKAIQIRPETHHDIKLIAALEGRLLQDVIKSAIDEYIANHLFTLGPKLHARTEDARTEAERGDSE